MEDYVFYKKYTDDILILKNKYQWELNLCKRGDDKFLLDSPAISIENPKCGFGLVTNYVGSYYIDLNGNRKFCNLPIKYGYPFTKYKKALVYLSYFDNIKYNFITTSGSLLFCTDFNLITPTKSDSLFYGILNDTKFIIDIEKEILFQEISKI